jgi:hypothetical protein
MGDTDIVSHSRILYKWYSRYVSSMLALHRLADTAGKLFGLALFERIFIVKTCLNHARSRGFTSSVSKPVKEPRID